jgi:hypothetical protein
MTDTLPLPEPERKAERHHPDFFTADQMREYAAAAVAAYKAKLIRELEARHLQHINSHNWYACLARELREGEL